MLYRTNEAAAAGESIDPLFDQIAARYRGIAADLNLGTDFNLEPELADVHDRIAAGAGADYAASRGEYLSGVILSKLLDRPTASSNNTMPPAMTVKRNAYSSRSLVV